MRYIVKGDAMESGGRTTAQAVSASGRHAVGLFGGSPPDEPAGPAHAHPNHRPSLPPRTLVLVRR